MPALNFQLVSLNCANTAAPVPASRVAERFLSSRYIASFSLFLSLSFSFAVFSFRYRTVKQLVETGNYAVPPSASTEPPVFLPFPRQKFFASYTQGVHRNVGHSWKMDSRYDEKNSRMSGKN